MLACVSFFIERFSHWFHDSIKIVFASLLLQTL